MERLKKYKTILWDFDGVILNSEVIREKGFIDVLKNYPENQITQLLEYHRINGGLSRYVKFRYFFEEIRKTEISSEEVQILADEFSKIMLKNLIDPTYLIQDSLRFIQSNDQNMNFHMVSGSDEIELNKICEGLEIAQYFKSIQGSPTPKNDLVKNLLRKEAYDLRQTCLIGDSINDAEAALVNQIDFYGYNNEALKKKFPNYIEAFSER